MHYFLFHEVLNGGGVNPYSHFNYLKVLIVSGCLYSNTDSINFDLPVPFPSSLLVQLYQALEFDETLF